MRFCVCALFLAIALSAAADLPLERTIEQGETHEELLRLPADFFVTLEIEQFDIDLEASVLDPAGAVVATGAIEYDTRISFITRSAGTHRLMLKPMKESSRRGTVRIALLESRPAEAKDQQRLDAQQSLFDGVMLLREKTAAAAARAIPLIERSLTERRTLGDCRGESWALYALAVAHGTMGDYERAAKIFHEALAIQRELGDLRGMTGSLLAIAGVTRSDPARARAVAEEALAISRVIGFTVSEAGARNLLGTSDGAKGEHRAAIANYEEALALTRRAGNPFQEALFTSNIGVSLAALGEWRQALTYLNDAVPIYRGIGEKHQLVNTLQNLGASYVWLGDHRSALEQFRLALPIAREVGNRRLEAINRVNSGVAHLELGQFAEARAALEEGLALTRAIEDLRQEAIALRHLARLDEKERRLDRALAQHERSLQLHQITSNRRGEAFALLNIGSLHRRLGDAEAARRSIREAHAIACDVEDPGLDSATRLALARVDAQQGDLDSAWRQLDAAMHGVESLRVHVAGQHLRGSYQLTLREYYDLGIDVLMRMHRKRPGRGFDALALQTSERARARGLLDQLAEAQVDVRQGGDPELLAREKKLRRAINDKAAQLARASKKDAAREVDKLVVELRQVETRIRASSPRYASLTQPAPLTVREIQRTVLDEDTMLIEIALGEQRGYVWAVTTDAVTVRELPSRREVESIARRFVDALTARNTRDADETPQARLERLAGAKEGLARDGARLYELIFQGAPEARTTRRLLIVADGALQYVPFAALPSRDGQRLVERFEIVSMPSVSALAALRRETNGRRAAERAVAVLADPVFADVRMPRLPLTRDEATSIARVAPRAEVLVGNDATRAAAMSKDLSRFRYIHFATHGIIDDRNPELSALVLSDGFLRLHDIYNLELPADLVVLSACQTALGKEVAHEGLVGLTRGFMYAGAERVLASLWKIDDRATAELMRRFYERMLVEEMTPAAALRAAQIEMARNARWSDPYHWAAFVLQGEWRP